MICTEQERDTLMAAVIEYGDQRQVFGFAAARNDGDRVGLATITADQIFAAIRAMLAPPDDAVVVPRDLAIRAIDRIERLAWWETECGEDEIARGSQIDADIFQDILRGEASSDE